MELFSNFSGCRVSLIQLDSYLMIYHVAWRWQPVVVDRSILALLIKKDWLSWFKNASSLGGRLAMKHERSLLSL
jgi:hypothetical protein